jgi:hypothetical protein
MFELYGTVHGVYTSLVDIGLGKFCMDFNPSNPKYSEELINDLFRREVKYLYNLQEYVWCPTGVEVDLAGRKIYFDWFENPLPENYAFQLEQIAKDLHNKKIYKPSFYQKYFYTDGSGTLHAFNFYSCSDYHEQPIDMNFYKPILNLDRAELIENIAPDGKLDMGVLIKYAFNNYIEWPNNPLPAIYKRVYE